ncbi:hypothetical protein V2A60_003223 [Cordyceps javanica]
MVLFSAISRIRKNAANAISASRPSPNQLGFMTGASNMSPLRIVMLPRAAVEYSVDPSSRKFISGQSVGKLSRSFRVALPQYAATEARRKLFVSFHPSVSLTVFRPVFARA